MTDVIVVGGGIAGCTTAYYLAADELDVLLLEQHEPNALASGSNAGSLHAQIQYEPFVQYGTQWARRFAAAVPFYVESIALWVAAENDLGVDLEVKKVGGILVAGSGEQMRHIEAKTRIECEAGLETVMLDRQELRRLAPYVNERLLGGAFCPSEGKANPLVAAPAFADAAVKLGARVLTGCEVTGITVRPGGYVVHTTRADYSAARVVNAAGINAGRIASLVGFPLQIEAYPIQLCVTEPIEPLVHHLVYAAQEKLTLKQTPAGTILIGGGWPSEVDCRGRAQVSVESLSRNLAVALDVVPSLGSANLVRSWAAIVNGTPDWLPILGELPGLPGFFMNYVPWMGFTGGPAGGRIVANLVQGREPPVDFDVQPFAPK